MYLKRCVEYEPNNPAHIEDLTNMRDIISSHEEMNKSKFVHDYKKCEAMCEKIVNKVKTSQVKLNYIECLIKNDKFEKALVFMRKEITDEEKKMEEFIYFASLANYYNGS